MEPVMPELPTILVRMSPELVTMLSGGVDACIWDFGEPDADGFYEPVVTLTVELPAL